MAATISTKVIDADQVAGISAESQGSEAYNALLESMLYFLIYYYSRKFCNLA